MFDYYKFYFNVNVINIHISVFFWCVLYIWGGAGEKGRGGERGGERGRERERERDSTLKCYFCLKNKR